MNIKLDRIISIATLLASLVAITLVLKKPAPVATPPQAPSSVEHAQSTDAGATIPRQAEQSSSSAPFSASPLPAAIPGVQTQPAPAASSAKVDPRINSDEISSMVGKMLGGSASTKDLSPDSNVGSGEPAIKDQQITMDGDIVHGKFLTTIGGKDVWVTISGHMGEKDGYATFDPTEFKVGDMNVPVSLVNPALQRKLAEERDRLKLPGN